MARYPEQPQDPFGERPFARIRLEMLGGERG
jgi:hypothetical protein